jgi:hypothetical protein
MRAALIRARLQRVIRRRSHEKSISPQMFPQELCGARPCQFSSLGFVERARVCQKAMIRRFVEKNPHRRTLRLQHLLGLLSLRHCHRPVSRAMVNLRRPSQPATSCGFIGAG